MKTFVVCSLFLFLCPSLWSQNLVRKNWRYSLEGKTLTSKEVKKMYRSVPLALEQYQKAQIQFGVSSGLILAVGALHGWPDRSLYSHR